MNKSKVLKVETCCNYADVTLVKNYGAVRVVYKVCLPENSVFRSNKKGVQKPLLKFGDQVRTLRDAGCDVAYLYNGHMHLIAAPRNCRDFMASLSLTDRTEFARILWHKVLQNKKVPSIMAYKNLQTIVAEYGLTRNKSK